MNKSTTSALLGLAITATPAFAQDTSAAAPQEQPAPLQAPAADELQLTQDPQVIRGQLENGFSYIIRPTNEPEGRASMRLYVATGSLDEQQETSGISHFLEHMVFNGSRNFKRGELIPAMQKLGLGFGGDANAYTSLQRTVYMAENGAGVAACIHHGRKLGRSVQIRHDRIPSLEVIQIHYTPISAL